MQTQPATNMELQKWIARHRGLVVESAWIEQCRKVVGISPESSSSDDTPLSCPAETQLAIKQAFRHFGMMP